MGLISLRPLGPVSPGIFWAFLCKLKILEILDNTNYGDAAPAVYTPFPGTSPAVPLSFRSAAPKSSVPASL